jgi:RHS repeat-associated protein
MTAIRESGATSGIGVLATFAYDQLGRRTSLTRGNGTVTGYTYDPVSRPGQMTQDIGGTTHDLTLDFAYNPASQIAATTRSNDAYAWTGHGSGTTNASSNGLNQIGTWTSSLGYDSKGNITSDGSYTYGYSSENLLTSLANPAGTQQTWSTFAYDPLMRLVVIDSSNNVLDARLGYDGQEIVLEDYGDGRKRRYVRGPGIDEPLVSIFVNAAGTFRDWYHADERGSIVAISNASGTAGATGKYDEYGAGTGVSRFHYTGQYWLADANLHYYRARIYDARLGRFLQPDPIGFGGGMNLYAYVKGDPVNRSDPSGLQDEPDIIITARSCNWICRLGRALSSNIGSGGSGGGSGFSGPVGPMATPRGPAPTGGRRGGTPMRPQPKPPETPPPPCPQELPNVRAQIDVGVFVGYGGGFTQGVDWDLETGAVVAFSSARAGTGLGWTAGAGLGLASSAPTAGRSSSRNASLSLGAEGASISVPTDGGKMSVNYGATFGPQIGGEISETENLTATKQLTGDVQLACTPH